MLDEIVTILILLAGAIVGGAIGLHICLHPGAMLFGCYIGIVVSAIAFIAIEELVSRLRKWNHARR